MAIRRGKKWQDPSKITRADDLLDAFDTDTVGAPVRRTPVTAPVAPVDTAPPVADPISDEVFESEYKGLEPPPGPPPTAPLVAEALKDTPMGRAGAKIDAAIGRVPSVTRDVTPEAAFVDKIGASRETSRALESKPGHGTWQQLMWSNYGKGKDITQPISTPYGMVDPLEKNIPPVPLADQLKGVVDTDDNLDRMGKVFTMFKKMNQEGRTKFTEYFKAHKDPKLRRLGGLLETLAPDAFDEPKKAETIEQLRAKDFSLLSPEKRAKYFANERAEAQGIAGSQDLTKSFMSLSKGWYTKTLAEQETMVRLLQAGNFQDKQLAEHFLQEMGKPAPVTYTEKEKRGREFIKNLKENNPKLYVRVLMKENGLSPNMTYERAAYRAGDIIDKFTDYLEKKKQNQITIDLVASNEDSTEREKKQAEILAQTGPSPFQFFNEIDDDGMVTVGGKKIPITRDLLARIIHKSMQDPALQGFEADFIKSLQGNKEGK